MCEAKLPYFNLVLNGEVSIKIDLLSVVNAIYNEAEHFLDTPDLHLNNQYKIATFEATNQEQGPHYGRTLSTFFEASCIARFASP